MGEAQSHSVTTMLRSAPCGRDGLAPGSSPAAMRSVQSANSLKARCVSSRPMLLTIWVMAWPDWMRRSQASTDDLNSPSSFGIVRIALLPIAWQP